MLMLQAANVEVVAEKFFADENEQLSVFTGNVVVTKEADKLVADKLVILFNDQREPLEYKASGNAEVDMIMQDKKYFAKADTMIYEPEKNQYTLIKDAFLHEIATDKKVYGDRIVVNQNTGRYEVDSDGKEPVKFIFQVKDEQE